MFVCGDCEKKLKLSEAGKKWPWITSQGECECCEKICICKDISTQFDWAWDDNINSDADLNING